MADLDLLRERLAAMGRLVLGYSGGVDSAVLAVAARQAVGPDAFLAVIGRSASYPEAQHVQALDLARRFDIPLLEIPTRELADPRYLANTTERCFYCKSELWTRLRAVADEGGYDALIDGTNATDLGEHRPGLRAAEERGVRSPLAELGWRKEDVRTAARALGLPSADTPASPCLSSRVLYGLGITPERLRQVELGEAWIRATGITGDLRVRHHGSTARIEVSSAELEQVRSIWGRLVPFFQELGFEFVELDPRGYRRGGLLALTVG
ncbi:MAG: ATP-dependent sacrificial sulfur transferase LarE [Gemmatimonadales bacterium]|nr:ATP-dependent sacrificial sulfur transferase LarE [Gemmatimonadales bacterium]